MSTASYVRGFMPKVIAFKMARAGIIKPPMPVTLTYSVTNMCQSRCKTCNLWKVYKDDPELKSKELTLDEIERIFKSIGHIYFFNISGGEPFLRKDLPEIVGLACKYLTPGVIHTPTNALAPDLIERKTVQLLDKMKENGCGMVPFTIKPSFDGVGNKHDFIRGRDGNFEKLLDTLGRLNNLKKEYSNLDVNLGTVISRFNIDDIEEISNYAERLNIDSYIHEIAEQRSELFTLTDPITPSADQYEKAVGYFTSIIRKNLKSKGTLSRYTQAFRLVYYDIVINTLKQNKQIIPCYAGITNVHINPYGGVWPCCVLGYNKPMGELRSQMADYDFKKIWWSEEAKKVREYIHSGSCHCPLANQAYSNILCNFNSMITVMRNIL